MSSRAPRFAIPFCSLTHDFISDSVQVAVKIINKSHLDEDALSMCIISFFMMRSCVWRFFAHHRTVMVYREISIMKMLRHQNIIRLYEIIDTEKVIFLIMEYASGGEVC